MRAPGSATAGLLAFSVTLGACTSLGPATPAGGPRATPVPPTRPIEVVPVDPLSADLARYYQQVESQRLARGLMRRDSGEVTPTASRLAQTWIAVALYDESPVGRDPRPAVLRRWAEPVRYSLEFGASTPETRRQSDRAAVSALANTLAEASGHPISLMPEGAGGNFHVLVLSENERRGAADRLATLIPGIDASTVRLLTEMPRETFCIVIAFARGGTATYTDAVAVIRAEHPDLTRLACYHEELTQGLGLAADSPQAWPSIFNDDQEFALLTDHDLLLLRMHYDPRLRPGMTETTARPLIFSIASEVLGGAS